MFNLKGMAKTVLYLQENGLTDFEELAQACDAAIAKYHDFAGRTKANSERMAAITELQKHIGAYVKTREIYALYRKLPLKKQTKFNVERILGMTLKEEDRDPRQEER